LCVLTEIRKKAVADSVGKVTESMMDGINFGVARVFANQKKIEQVPYCVNFWLLCCGVQRWFSDHSQQKNRRPKCWSPSVLDSTR
jgi:hypothetical protein